MAPDRKLVAANFTRAAGTYPAHAAAQAHVAETLLTLAPPAAQAILEPGCGTGQFTARLRQLFPEAQLFAFDLTPELARLARTAGGGVHTAAADACRPPWRAAFDLIAANAVFHWLDTPAVLIARYHRLLTPNGTLLFSAFGPRTFRELGEALRRATGTDLQPTAAGFADGEHWRLALTANCRNPVVEAMEWREEFPDLLALLRRIKYTGTRGGGLGGLTLTRKIIQQAEQHYRERQGGIFATWQVFLCRGSR